MCASPATIEVGDLDGGPTIVYTAPAGGATMAQSMAVGPEAIAVVAWAGSSGPPTSELLVISRATGAARPVVPDDGATFERVQLRGDGRFEAFEGCCADGPLRPCPRVALVALDGVEVDERQPIQVGPPVFSAVRDRSGGVLVIAGEQDGALYVDGRLVRPGVFSVAG